MLMTHHPAAPSGTPETNRIDQVLPVSPGQSRM